MTTPRAKIWTNVNFTKALTTAATEVFQDTLVNLLAGLGLVSPIGFTVIDTRVRGLIHSDDGDTSAGFVTLNWGIGVYPALMDSGDFPRLAEYEGDWLIWGTQNVQLAGAISTIVLPEMNAVIDARSRAQRRITDLGQTLFFVIEEDVSEGIDVELSVSHLLLMP